MKKSLIALITAYTLLLTFSAFAAQETRAAELEKTDISVGYLTNATSHLFAYVAYENGYFEEEGLNAELIQFASSSELVAALEGNKLDVALIGSVPTLTFAANGHDLSIFGGAMTNGHGLVIKGEEVPEGEKITIEVLKGKNVASVKNSIQDAELLTILKNNDIEVGEGEDQVNIWYFDSQKDAYAALQNQQIDASVIYAPYSSIADKEGRKVVYYCNEVEELKNQPCCRQATLADFLETYPNTYIAFERAIIKAYKFYQEDHEGTLEITKKYVDIDLDDLDFEIYGGHALVNPDPDKQATLKLKDSIVELGYVEDFDASGIFNLDIYQEALSSLIEENPEDPIYQELQAHFDEFE